MLLKKKKPEKNAVSDAFHITFLVHHHLLWKILPNLCRVPNSTATLGGNMAIVNSFWHPLRVANFWGFMRLSENVEDCCHKNKIKSKLQVFQFKMIRFLSKALA